MGVFTPLAFDQLDPEAAHQPRNRIITAQALVSRLAGQGTDLAPLRDPIVPLEETSRP